MQVTSASDSIFLHSSEWDEWGNELDEHGVIKKQKEETTGPTGKSLEHPQHLQLESGNSIQNLREGAESGKIKHNQWYKHGKPQLSAGGVVTNYVVHNSGLVGTFYKHRRPGATISGYEIFHPTKGRVDHGSTPEMNGYSDKKFKQEVNIAMNRHIAPLTGRLID